MIPVVTGPKNATKMAEKVAAKLWCLQQGLGLGINGGGGGGREEGEDYGKADYTQGQWGSVEVRIWEENYFYIWVQIRIRSKAIVNLGG